MKLNDRARFSTICIHAGQEPDPSTGAIITPIYQTSTYVQEGLGQHKGYEYGRTHNPTRMALERNLAAIEAGVAGFAFASGMAAIDAILTRLESGDHVLVSDNTYGGTFRLFERVRRKFGLDFTYVDTSRLELIEPAITAKTKYLFIETPTNPMLQITDLAAASEIAHRHNVRVVVDNTFASPYIQQPLVLGADIVTHSTTKFLGGHGTTIGGAIVDGGNFDWTSGRFANFTTPDPSYHGLVYADLGAPAFILKARVQILRDFGGCQAPFNSWQTIQGIETLSLRMDRHVANAQRAAEFLAAHPKVAWVSHPGLASHPDHARAAKYLPKGAGAIFGFGIQGGIEAGRRFIEGLELFSHLANVGDAKSLAIHPATTTHSQLSEDEMVGAGVSPDFIRLSIGIEDIEDILWDLGQALEKA